MCRHTVQKSWRPDSLSEVERDAARYRLTDLLDDLIHSTDAGERMVVAAAAWTVAAEQHLAFNRHWTGTGKWLLRELADLDPDFAARWLAANMDATAIEELVREVLTPVGGPLFAGYRVSGESPARGDQRGGAVGGRGSTDSGNGRGFT